MNQVIITWGHCQFPLIGTPRVSKMAFEIMNALSRCQLNWRLDEITQGDGNCFPRAVVQQCQRTEVQESLESSRKSHTKDHRSLRQAVCQFMLHPCHPCVEAYKKSYMEKVYPSSRISWEDYWIGMSQDKVWVDDRFIQGAAWYLGQDIWIVTTGSTPEMPYFAYSGNIDDSSVPCSGVPLLVGYQLNLHYQSLLPSRHSQERRELSFSEDEFPPLGSKAPNKNKKVKLDDSRNSSGKVGVLTQWLPLPREGEPILQAP